jgi:hypothetical protein
VAVDLGREDLEDRRKRQEVLAQPEQSTTSPALSQFYENGKHRERNWIGIYVPCKNSGKKAMKNTRKILMIQRWIQRKVGIRL